MRAVPAVPALPARGAVVRPRSTRLWRLRGAWRYACTAGRGTEGDGGNALVETALVAPLLLMLAFGVVGVSRVTRAELGVSAVAQEAARVGALAGGPAEARTRALARGQEIAANYGLANGSLRLVVDPGGFNRGGEVRASAAYDVRLDDLPLLGWITVPVRSTHVELIDLYRSR